MKRNCDKKGITIHNRIVIPYSDIQIPKTKEVIYIVFIRSTATIKFYLSYNYEELYQPYF